MKSKDGLLAELSSRIAQSKNRYCKQLLRHPLKMLYPKMLSTSKQTHRVKALTFWGGEITVILPNWWPQKSGGTVFLRETFVHSC